MNRRGFLQLCLAAAAAPAIVRMESLMKLYVPQLPPIMLWGDGVTDDTVALQTWLDGGLVIKPDGTVFSGNILANGSYRIRSPLVIKRDSIIISNNFFRVTP